jgi:hypothetical protein
VSSVVKEKIKKVKSFDKRIEILTNNDLSTIEPEAAKECIALVAEKAKYGQHFAELVSVGGRLDFEGKESRLLEFALRANEHPTQAGTSAWVLSKLGFAESARRVIQELIDSTKLGHPNLYAQALGFGLLIPEMRKEIIDLIDKAKMESPDVPENLYFEPDMSRFLYLQAWLDD